METTQILNPAIADLQHLSRWDRLLIHSLRNLTGGQLRLIFPGGRIVETGKGQGDRAEWVLHRKDLSKTLLMGGAMAFAETFILGAWSTPDLSALLRVLGRSQRDMGRFARGTSRLLREMDRLLHRKRRNTRQNALRNIQAHYDLSNDLYAAFLDPDLNYSSAIFRSTADTLAQAQIHKLDRVIAQLRPGPDDHVLEIGSGWGACAIRMARETGCRVTSITLSHQQAEEARRRVAAAGLSDRVEIRLQDYRDVEGTFDHVVSLEMIEAVGHDFLPGYFRMLDQRLREGGLVLLQAITIPDDRYESYHRSVDFIRKHIFPGGHLPCPRLLEELRERETRLRLVDTFEFARDYAETLRRWRYQFFARLDQVRALGFDDAFIRKWQFYLSYCEAGFDTGLIHVHQLCYEKSRRD